MYSFESPLPWAPKEGGSIHESFVSNDYFVHEFLNRSEGGLFDITSYSPAIMISFLVVTVITFLIIYEGIDSSKYAVYVIVPLPYILMTILFIKGLSLEGHTIGWYYLFKPDWSKLFTFRIWGDAAGQVLFSAGLAQNTIVKFASHRHDNDPLFLSTVMIPVMNFATSIFAAFTLFSFVGYASHQTGIPISEMPVKGMELTFVVYPALLNILPFPQFWSATFFLMLLLLGLGTEYIFIE
jgi:SNF family Na+-dependent transporter